MAQLQQPARHAPWATSCRNPGAASSRNARATSSESAFERASNHEKTDSTPVRAGGVEPLKRIEDSRQFLRRDTDARVINIDPNLSARTPASNEDAPTGFSILDSIGYEVAKDAPEKHRIT